MWRNKFFCGRMKMKKKSLEEVIKKKINIKEIDKVTMDTRELKEGMFLSP